MSQVCVMHASEEKWQLNSTPTARMWSAIHQTLGAIEYNVTNNFDDLQRPSGSQFMQSTFVDDDSLMKDSRGKRHGGRLDAFISTP